MCDIGILPMGIQVLRLQTETNKMTGRNRVVMALVSQMLHLQVMLFALMAVIRCLLRR